MQVARETVQFCNHQCRFLLPAKGEGHLQLRTVFPLAALDFREFSEEVPFPAVQVGPYGGLLGIEAKTAFALLVVETR